MAGWKPVLPGAAGEGVWSEPTDAHNSRRVRGRCRRESCDRRRVQRATAEAGGIVRRLTAAATRRTGIRRWESAENLSADRLSRCRGVHRSSHAQRPRASDGRPMWTICRILPGRPLNAERREGVARASSRFLSSGAYGNDAVRRRCRQRFQPRFSWEGIRAFRHPDGRNGGRPARRMRPRGLRAGCRSRP